MQSPLRVWVCASAQCIPCSERCGSGRYAASAPRLEDALSRGAFRDDPRSAAALCIERIKVNQTKLGGTFDGMSEGFWMRKAGKQEG
jgi:hypothetical protein